MDRIKVGFVIDEWTSGGTETQLFMLIRGLDRNRFEPLLVLLRDSPLLRTTSFACRSIVLNVRKLKSFSCVRDLLRLATALRRQKIDILQTFFFDSTIFGVMAARLGGVSCLVSSRRDMGFWYTPKLERVLRAIDAVVDHYLVNCQSVREHLSRQLGVCSSKVTVVYNGVDLKPFSAVGSDLREQTKRHLGIPVDCLVVGTISNLNRPVKRVDLLLEAAAEISKSCENVVFVIVGGGPLEPRLRSLAETLRIADRIIWVGMQADVIPYLSTFDVGVLCSESEGFSNSILEYMAAGVPVVATDVGGNREIIQHGFNGLLVASDDSVGLAFAIETLLRDNDLKRLFGENARQVARNFGVEKMVSEHERFYESVMRAQD